MSTANYTELKKEQADIKMKLSLDLVSSSMAESLRSRYDEISRQLRQMEREDNGNYDLADLPHGHPLKP